jgi:hypothetical protein
MTTAVKTAPGISSRLVNGLLAIKPLANLAKHQARTMMIKRAERIGVPWTKQVKELSQLDWGTQARESTKPRASLPRILCAIVSCLRKR